MSAADPDIPDHFQVVLLDLAAEPGHPGSSVSDRYTLLLPLGRDDRILEAQARRHPDYCRVSRADPAGAVASGLMRPGPDQSWRFDFDGAEESGVRFAEARFSPGDCVTIQRGRDTRTYRVISRQDI